jgi:hypothetical protein
LFVAKAFGRPKGWPPAPACRPWNHPRNFPGLCELLHKSERCFGPFSCYRMAANFRMACRANLNIRGWQGRWRYTAPTALFFGPSVPASGFIPLRLRKFFPLGSLRSQKILC